MTCGDLEQLLDRFLDSQLPPPMLLAVAKHAAECPACDITVQSAARVQEAVATTVHHAADALDLGGMWARIEREIGAPGHVESLRPLPRRSAARPGWKRAPIWASVAAMAASALVWVRGPILQTAKPPAPVKVAAARRTNHTVIDRLAGKDVAVRREPKTGTTIIWVNYTP